MSLLTSTSFAATATELFPLDRVRLLDGPFKDAQEVDRKHLLVHDVDRLLAPFRAEAGLKPRAPQYGNWESSGLGGQTAGHYLSAISMMHAATGDAELKRRIDYMVGELAECQKANGNGYVGGVPESKEVWPEVAAGKLKVTGFGLNDRWVPWYNLHKTYAGLRDAHLIGGNAQAKAVLIGMADWCDALLARLSDEQVQQMLAAEHGGMNEVLADVSAITGDAKYLRLARRFSHRAILDPLAAGRDDLTGKHANTQIPKVVGFRRIAALDGGGDDAFRRAAVFFWENVTMRRSVAIGGNSVGEHFHPPDNFATMLEDRTGPETCNTYNMLRLTEGLFQDDAQARYADFYERALYNHILASQHPQRGGFVYFTPMRPRHYRVYSRANQAFWCCVGTGFENHAKYGQFIYAKGANANPTADANADANANHPAAPAGSPASAGADARPSDALYVNLFIASELQWTERGVTVRQETKFPDEPSTRLTIAAEMPATWALHLRHPHWVPAGELKALVNGEPHPIDSAPSSYARIERTWSSGDVVEVKLPMRVTAERLPDGSDHIAFRYGPLVLAAATGREPADEFFAGDGRGDHVARGPLLPVHDAPALVTDASDPQRIADAVRATPGASLTFALPPELVRPEKYRELKLVPFHRLHESRYVVYWRVLAPEAYAAEMKRVEAGERERLALDAATLDRVTPGEQQSEVDHHFKGERTGNGYFRDRSWRDAPGGWFSYQLKAPDDEPAELLVTYYGRDRGRRFDVLVNDAKIAEVHLDGRNADDYFTVRYPLPADAAGRAVTVKFVAHEQSIAGGIFDLRLVKAQPEPVAQ